MMTGEIQSVSNQAPILDRRFLLFAIVGYLALTLLMFGDVLFAAKDLVLSNAGTDTYGQFLSWRKFGFEELRQGNVPLWNPYIFCGAPYFGGFQAALIYPLNVLFLFLPLAKAINWSIALHVFLAGLFVYLWTSHRKLHPLACFLGGVVWMFSGPYFFHIYAGHLPNLCTIVWAPLVLLTVDGILERASVGWTLFGIIVLAMQILAGHPQYVFYTSIIAGLYGLMRVGDAPQKTRTILCAFAIYIGAVALTAIQLFTGAQATAESIRSVGLSSGFAASFSFPPEGFLMLFAPKFFGNMGDVPYWGRWLLWEMCIYCGITGFVLAVYGAVGGYNKQRSVLILVILISCVLALGANTKLFDLLYNFVPGFNKFRSSSKFMALTALFIALLASIGLNDLIRRGKPGRKLILTTAAFAIFLAVAGVAIQWSAVDPAGFWRNFTKFIAATEQSSLALSFFSKPEFVEQIGRHAANSLLVAAAITVSLALIFLCAHWLRRGLYLIVLFGVVELFIFARSTRDSFELSEQLSEAKKLFATVAGEGRCNFSVTRNLPMYFGKADIWGNDPGIPMRYAELMVYLQGIKPEFAAEFDVTKIHPFFDALRCRYTVAGTPGSLRLLERTNVAPHLSLVSHYRLVNGKTNIFQAINDKNFDPLHEVILEAQPKPGPTPSVSPGAVKLLSSTSDSLEIEADVVSPTLLLITDSYTPSWKARALSGSSQATYEVMPADYCLRAVPLSTGHHHLLVEYVPRAFDVGRIVSISACVLYLGALLWWFRRKSAGIA